MHHIERYHSREYERVLPNSWTRSHRHSCSPRGCLYSLTRNCKAGTWLGLTSLDLLKLGDNSHHWEMGMLQHPELSLIACLKGSTALQLRAG